jgi:hypothetical protein
MYVIYKYDEKVKSDVAVQNQTIDEFLSLTGISDQKTIDHVYAQLAKYGDYSHEGLNSDVITIADTSFTSSDEISVIYGLNNH